MAKYSAGVRETCPHCLTVVRFENLKLHGTIYTGSSHIIFEYEGSAEEKPYRLSFAKCPSCGKFIITLAKTEKRFGVDQEVYLPDFNEDVLWPLNTNRPVPEEIPRHIA